MRKRGLCCPRWPSVCRSVCHAGALYPHGCNRQTYFSVRYPIILDFLTLSADTQFRGELLQRGRKVHGVWKNLRLSTEIAVYVGNCTRQAHAWLLWKVSRKSQVADRSVSVPMTLSDPNMGFKVTVYLQVKYFINLGTKLLQNSNRKPYPIFRMVPLSMTINDL